MDHEGIFPGACGCGNGLNLQMRSPQEEVGMPEATYYGTQGSVPMRKHFKAGHAILKAGMLRPHGTVWCNRKASYTELQPSDHLLQEHISYKVSHGDC